MWLDYEGCDDVYECLTFSGDCGEIPQEQLWHGCPDEDPPQDCDVNCQSARYATALPKHCKAVGSWDEAWKSLDSGLRGPKANIILTKSDSKIYKVPAGQAGVGRDVYMIIVKVPTSMPGKAPKVIGDRYFALETDPLGGDVDATPTYPYKAKVGPGSQLRIDFQVGGELRRALVWLKE